MTSSRKSDCIEFQGAKTRDGYGQKIYKGVTRRVHRIAYCEHHGLELSDIDGLVIMHTCDNPPCYNPAHLVLGTQQENVADMRAKGRFRRLDGEFNPRAKLSVNKAENMRRLHASGLSYSAIAKRYKVSPSTVGRAIRREIWV